MPLDITLTLSPKEASAKRYYIPQAARQLRIPESYIALALITKRSIDARRKPVKVVLGLRIFVDDEPMPENPPLEYPDVKGRPEVIIVGAGPAGLFAALSLIENGFCPILIERGKRVAERKKDIALINRNIALEAESNYAFGEGGAGTFSDGKLYTRSKKRGDYNKALRVLVHHGASEEILYDAHPHIGTDKLPGVIGNIRQTIERAGGRILFSTRLTDLIIREGRVTGIRTKAVESSIREEERREGLQDDGESGEMPKKAGISPKEADHTEIITRGQESAITEPGFSGTLEGVAVILATGHSARDIYELLHRKGVRIEAKPYAMGVRIEHPQSLIDSIQYHMPQRGEFLPAASYSLVTQVAGRGVYSFCMCPGGFIVPALTSESESVVNGMSPSDRNSRYANSGIVTEIRESDFGHLREKHGELAGLEFQKRFEQAARTAAEQAGGKPFAAPGLRVADFVAGRLSADLPRTSFVPGTVGSDPGIWMPDFIRDSLRAGIGDFGRKMKGFVTNDALILGVESRTSTPVRIPRERDTLCHPEIGGLYPSGEGAGYAGGIISAALDGERVAVSISKTFK